MAKKKTDLLSSWKEIASYLDCDVRTAHRWEKEYGLPVHRLGKGVRARVYAYEHELDAWLKKKTGETSRKTSSSIIKAVLLVSIAVLVLIAGFFAYQYWTFDREPYGFDIEQSQLIVLNRDGQELWRKDFDISYSLDEELYRERFQNKAYKEGHAVFPVMQIKDINQDGYKEVLFGMAEIIDGGFFCLSHKGKELWKIQSGRELVFGSRIYSNQYRISKCLSHDLNGNGFHEIIVTSSHMEEFPTQMLLLNHKGEILGEYWNSGRFGDFVFEDLNGDGVKEIVCGGVNNQFDAPFAAVFDMNHVSGSSPNTGEYASASLEPGSEKFYFLLPRTNVAQALYPNEKIGRIIKRNEEIWSFFTTPTDLQYRFDEKFRILEVWDSHNFEMLFRKAKAGGFISGELNKEYLESLEGEIRYHNGKEWVSEPAMRNEW